MFVARDIKHKLWGPFFTHPVSIYISNICVLNTAVSTMVVKQIHLMSATIQIAKCHATAKLKTINYDSIKGGPESPRNSHF